MIGCNNARPFRKRSALISEIWVVRKLAYSKQSRLRSTDILKNPTPSRPISLIKYALVYGG